MYRSMEYRCTGVWSTGVQEYGVQVWNPFKHGLIDKIEAVQSRAVKDNKAGHRMRSPGLQRKIKVPEVHSLVDRRRADDVA